MVQILHKLVIISVNYKKNRKGFFMKHRVLVDKKAHTCIAYVDFVCSKFPQKMTSRQESSL